MNGFIAVHCGKQNILILNYLYFWLFWNKNKWWWDQHLFLEMLRLITCFTGAGYHSDSLKKDYQKTCYAACRKAGEALQSGGNAVDAVEKAIIGLY